MADVKTVVAELTSISTTITKVARMTGYLENGEVSHLDINRKNADDLFLSDEIKRVLDKLADIQGWIDYLNLPIKYESRLFENESGRYETDREDYYTSGHLIEFLCEDEDRHEHPYWCRSRVEYNGERYYIVGHKNLPMEGVTVRVRGRIA